MEASVQLRVLPVALLVMLIGTLGRGGELRVHPSEVVLTTPEASEQLLVASVSADQREIDLTRRVTFETADPRIASVSELGRVEPVGEGSTEVLIRNDDHLVRVRVDVRGIEAPTPVSFRREIIPILSKAGCNSGGCHGKAEGQNGFKLSVFGFDPAADHIALSKEGRGRRVSLAAPEQSLLLLKSSGAMPHGGGVKIPKGSLWYRLVERWIAEGAKDVAEATLAIARIEVQPSDVVFAPGQTQQLKVTAIDEAGNRRCVTAEAEFQSNAEVIAGVGRDGLAAVTGVPGEAAILVRYMGNVTVARLTLPQPGVVFERPAEHNFIDRLAWDKLQRLGIAPSKLADDATFLRRVYLDTIGTLPTIAEARRFLGNPDQNKRSRLIDELLERNEYADYQAMRWADILRVDKDKVTPQGAVAMTRWLRRQFRQNIPYDKFAREIVTARGNTLSEGPAGFYQVHEKPEVMARSISQLFLGVRIECAQCHHHPFEKWGQADYFALAGFFSGVSKKASPTGGQKIVSQGGSHLKHPRTGEEVPTAGLGAGPADLESYRDRREAFADWLVDANNPFFTRMITNRLWAHYFGRGLVEPIDDMRATNPATNEPLLDALAKHLVDVKFDLKAFTCTVLNSRAYQLSYVPNDSNELDQQNFSHATWKALPAEVLLDAICQATRVPEEFNGWPSGYRAIQIWDNRMPSYFFRIFGRPARISVCECERGNEPSMAQALHLMNSPESVRKIRHRDGLARQLSESERMPDQIIAELYLATVSRLPTDNEIGLMRQAFTESDNRQSATEDVLWALLNAREFVYNH
jgi:hypothetical protein